MATQRRALGPFSAACYPRTGKYGAKPGPHFFQLEANYYEGEE